MKFLKNREIFYKELRKYSNRIGGRDLSFIITNIEIFKKYFGFKEIIYDVNKKLNLNFILDLAHSFQDLSEILNIEPINTGLNQTLSLNFDLDISKPLYDEKTHTLYFSEKNACGNIALFYFQAFLHYIGKCLLKDEAKAINFLLYLDNINEINDIKIKDNLKKLLFTLTKNKIIQAQEKILIANKIGQREKIIAQKYIQNYINNINQKKTKYFTEYENSKNIDFLKKVNEYDIYFQYINELLRLKTNNELYLYLTKLKQDKVLIPPELEKFLFINLAPIQETPFYIYKVKEIYENNDFYKNNLKIDELDKKIVETKSIEWATSLELLKKAFVSFIYDKLNAIERTNEFLTSNAHNEIFFNRFDNDFKPFPENIERENINIDFNKLILSLNFNKDLNLNQKHINFDIQRENLENLINSHIFIVNIIVKNNFKLTLQSTLKSLTPYIEKAYKLGLENFKQILINRIHESILYKVPAYFSFAFNCLQKNNQDLTYFFKHKKNIVDNLINNENLFSLLPKNLQYDKNLIIQVVKKNVNLLNLIDPALLTGAENSTFIEKLIKQNGLSINFIGTKERRDKNLILKAIKQNPKSYFYLDSVCKENIDINRMAIQTCPELINSINNDILNKIKPFLNNQILYKIQQQNLF